MFPIQFMKASHKTFGHISIFPFKDKMYIHYLEVSFMFGIIIDFFLHLFHTGIYYDGSGKMTY